MSLTTKPRQGVVHKQIRAAHQHKSKHYLKTYWPYIPVIIVAGFGLYISSNWHYSVTSSGQNLTSYSYYSILESSVGLAALAIFLLRHAFAWHKVFIKSESFALKHPLLDVLLASLAVIGLLLSHHNIPA